MAYKTIERKYVNEEEMTYDNNVEEVTYDNYELRTSHKLRFKYYSGIMTKLETEYVLIHLSSHTKLFFV